VNKNADSIRALVNDAGKVWAPTLGRFVPKEILQVILQRTLHTSCRSVEDAAALIAAGFQSALITRPVVSPESLLQAASLAECAKLTVVIDHFRHAELLSRTLLETGATASVLIDVDVGRQVTGVRPGPDSALLAAAIAQLPNIRLDGVYVDDQHCGTGVTGDSMPMSFEESIEVAQHCQKIIKSNGIACSQVVSGRIQIHAAAGRKSVTTMTASPFAVQHESTNGVSLVAGEDQTPALSLVCRVISRPSLEWCIIDAGKLFWDNSASLQIMKPSGARLLHALSDIATILLSGESLDLRIGDEVLLTHRDFFSRLALGESHGVIIS
jgi:D-serine deaminase-like pyridoxal phosphate-dependent protein